MVIFWSCFAVYGICSAFTATYSTGMIKVIQVIQAVAILGIIYVVSSTAQFSVKNNFLRITLVLYVMYSIFILFHGYEYTYEFTKRLFFSSFIKYFFPLILLIPKNLKFYSRIFDVIIIYSVAFIFLNIIFADLVFVHYEKNINQKFAFEGFFKNLGITVAFLLFTYKYHSKNRILLALLVLLMIIGTSTFKARRAIMVLSTFHLLIFMVIFYLKSNYKLVMSGILALFIGVLAVYGPKFYKENKYTYFGELNERGTEDTRTGVEIAMARDFEPVDWVIGRGINGKYWCPNIDLNDTSGYRVMIETDYLNIILKGGVIYLGLILIMAIPAAFKAFFFSNNLLSKAAGIWIVLWILSLYPLNVFNTDLNHMLLWVCVGIGFSKDLRNMSDETIKESFSG
ncbi:hypothetical protein SAMN04488057_105316 [Cyclobacterium lianum]|uniref:O-antigen ligase like membrane protein n=2 Tax=Cyclobacterium lianum TaxID=388280 RepID=A0A1M7NGS4_9BACT|nr:hypothetical protein SAMN04488057_105316 [Cyclobacterium lianum]